MKSSTTCNGQTQYGALKTVNLFLVLVVLGLPASGSLADEPSHEATSAKCGRTSLTSRLVTGGGDECCDADGDDYGIGSACLGPDCDDRDPTVNPGAPELCGNAVDDDCDGETDEGCACEDTDGDGYGVGNGCRGPDCDDDNATINPTAPELCGNDVDENCDGQTDEACDCDDADGDGYRTAAEGCGGPDCDDDDPTVNPGAPELCGNNFDDDCDGELDEGFTYPGPWRNEECQTIEIVAMPIGGDCVKGLGQCARVGTVVCSEDKLSAECDAVPGAPDPEGADGPDDDTCFDLIDNDCNGLADHEEYPCQAEEVCDGFDNDNDGEIDERFTDLGQECQVGVGACETTGFMICKPDESGTFCDAVPALPGTEGPPGSASCSDGVDNDCDRVTDLDDLDSCRQDEICDGVDNDGNGEIDETFENLGEFCSAGVGACAVEGVYVCSADRQSTICSASAATGSPEGPEGITCQDGIDNDCDGMIDEEDPSCASLDLVATCSLPYLRGRPGSDCTGWHVIQFGYTGGRENAEVRAELLAMDVDGNILETLPVDNGEHAHLASRVSPDDFKAVTRMRGSREGKRRWHEVFAPIPMLRVTVLDGASRSEAFCSNIPVMQVLRPNNAVVSKSEGELTGVLAAIPRVDPHTLVIQVDEVDILEALAIDPMTDFPGGPFDGTVEINGQLVDVTDLIVRSGAIGEPGGNIVSMKLGNLGCGGHVVAVDGEKRRGSLPKTVSGQCHRDDIQASGVSMVFGIEISSPLPGEVIMDSSGGVPSSINVTGEVCHGREIASLKINGLVVDTDFGQSVVAGGGENSATTVLVPFSVDVPVADIRQILDTGEDPVGTFEPGTNRLIAQATDVERNSEFESLFFAVGPVIPVPEAEALYAMVASAAEEEVVTEVERAFTLVLSTEGINKFFHEICADIGPRIKHKVECKLKNNTFGPNRIPMPWWSCDPKNVTTQVTAVNVSDTFPCEIHSFPRTVEDPPNGRVTVKIGLPDFFISTYTSGGCESSTDFGLFTVCWSRVVIQLWAAYNMQDVSLTFTITEDNILNGTPRAKPIVNKGTLQKENGKVKAFDVINHCRLGCITGDIATALLELLRFLHDVFGLDGGHFDFRKRFEARLADRDLGGHFDGLKGDFRETRRFRFDNDELAEKKLVIAHELSEVKFTADSLSVAANATFTTLESSPEATDVPGSQLTEAGLLDMPIPDPPDVVSSDEAGDVVVAVSDDFFNQLFASLVRAGGLNTGFDLAERTLLDMLPDFLGDCDTPFCVGFRGEDCSQFALPGRRERCQEVKDRNLRPMTRVILHARMDTPPSLLIDDAPPAGGSGVPVIMRYPQISLAVIADRDGVEGFQSSLSEMSPCFGGGFTANTECTLWEACLDAIIEVTMERDYVERDGRRKSRIRFRDFSFVPTLTKGNICGGSSAEEVNPDDDPDQDRLIDRIREFAEDEGLLDRLRGRLETETPKLESSGLDFGDVVDFEDDEGINVISIGNSGRDFRDYIGVTGNLSRRDRQRRPTVCCYGDADGDDFGIAPECTDPDCNDADPNVYPGAPEFCGNGIDDNCNGEIDEPGCCTDNDGDGYGSGRECLGRDCDDADPTVNPGAPERCANGVNDDCDWRTDEQICCVDADGDGYGAGRVCLGDDCNDANPAINPGAPEVCGNAVDENCNGQINEGCWPP